MVIISQIEVVLFLFVRRLEARSCHSKFSPSFPYLDVFSDVFPSGAAVTLLQSSFIFPIAGTVYFRQVAGEEVQMWGKVYWTNDSPTTLNHNWHIHMLAVSIH